MTTGRINQVTIFRAPAPGDTRSRPRGAPRLAGRSRAERFSIETRPTRGANPARRPCCVAPPRPPRALRARSEARKAPSLEARLCEFLPGRSSDPEEQAPAGGKRVSHLGRRLPAGRPAALARPARPSSAPPRRRRRDERPVRPSSLLDLTLAQRVAVQAPHPRRPASHDGERPPTARPPLGGPAVSDLDTTRRRTPSRSPRLPEGARRRPRPGGVLCRPSGPGSARAPGPAMKGVGCVAGGLPPRATARAPEEAPLPP